MKEIDLPIDRSKHVIYTRKAKKCVQGLLHRYYDEKTAGDLWEKIQLQYVEFLKDEPALGGVKMTVSIYDPILIFAWYVTVPDKPAFSEVQQDVYDCFMGGFDLLGKVFDLNRKTDNRLANKAFKKASDLREKEINRFPASLLMCDKEAIEVQKILPFLSDTWPLCRIGRAVIRASQSCRQSCNKSQCPACGCRSHHSCTHAPQFSRSFPAREWGSVLQRQGACGQCP